MSRQTSRIVWTVGVTVVLAAAGSTGSSLALARQDDAPRIPLPAQDRRQIEKYLGRGVVGAPVPAYALEEAKVFLSLDDVQYEYRVTYGKSKGKTRVAELSRLSRTDNTSTRWKFFNGIDQVLYGQLTADGSLEGYSTESRDQGVVSRFEPPEPGMITGMRPGQTITRRIHVSVFDLSEPGKQKHSGHLDLEHTYVGAYRVTVPAGTFDAVLLRWRYDGKVGPANVKDEQYWFLARGNGVVAMIQKSDVSAFLVYQDHDKFAAVLLERRTR